MSIHPSLIFDKVQKKIILAAPTKENLYELLVISNPSFTLEQVSNDLDRLEAMKNLMVSIHPSNFPDNEDSQSLYEDVQAFYDACCKEIHEPTDVKAPKSIRANRRRNRNTPSPTTVVESVVQFNVRQKWSYLTNWIRPLSPVKLTSGKVLAPLVAYQCINARGAIAHGKRPTLIYSWENAYSCNGMSVQDVLVKHGGVKSITDGKVEEIKLEIIHNGPVISFSFIPDKDFAKKHENSIVKSRVKKHHYCMIIGWKLTEYGEGTYNSLFYNSTLDKIQNSTFLFLSHKVWLVQNYDGTEIMQVPIGQYNIEETILAPKDDFLSTSWQQGPYFDLDMTGIKDWLHTGTIHFSLKSSELERFAKMLGGIGFHEAITKKTRIVLRDDKKPAHSRSCKLQDVQWEQNSLSWKVSCMFNDNGCSPRSEETGF